ncbi:MAG TPA: hypothetical protein VMV31_02800 [Terriglobales bacterium]|nr:hypothetical protein [Terriglobales bacterium]
MSRDFQSRRRDLAAIVAEPGFAQRPDRDAVLRELIELDRRLASEREVAA